MYSSRSLLDVTLMGNFVLATLFAGVFNVFFAWGSDVLLGTGFDVLLDWGSDMLLARGSIVFVTIGKASGCDLFFEPCLVFVDILALVGMCL